MYLCLLNQGFICADEFHLLETCFPRKPLQFCPQKWPKMLVLQLVPLVLKSLLMLPLCLHFVPPVVLLRSDFPFVFFPFSLPFL